jgi:hypothetical protein
LAVELDDVVVPFVLDTEGVAAGVGGAAAVGVDAAALASRFKIDFPGVTGVVLVVAAEDGLLAGCLTFCWEDAGALSRLGMLDAMRTLAELSDCHPFDVVSRSETASAGTSHPEASLTVGTPPPFTEAAEFGTWFFVLLLAVGTAGWLALFAICILSWFETEAGVKATFSLLLLRLRAAPSFDLLLFMLVDVEGPSL